MHNEKLRNLCTSSDIIRMIRSRRVRWAGSTHGRDEKCMQNLGRKT
jgi:hypothetical protein